MHPFNAVTGHTRGGGTHSPLHPLCTTIILFQKAKAKQLINTTCQLPYPPLKTVQRLGATSEPYGVFWLEICQILSDKSLIVRNLPEKGKRKIQQLEERIESDLVFPAVRGSDVKRWSAIPKIYILMPQDPKECAPFPEPMMKKKWPRTYGYLLHFKNVLLSRGSKTVREFAERTAFYAMFGIGPYTVAPYKVIWKRMSNDLCASVISQFKTPFGYKQIIPTDTTSLFAFKSEEEAHYLCAILNSKTIGDFIKSFSSAGRGFGSPSVMSHLCIPEFDSNNNNHLVLSNISKFFHDEVNVDKSFKSALKEDENDLLVRKLMGI